MISVLLPDTTSFLPITFLSLPNRDRHKPSLIRGMGAMSFQTPTRRSGRPYGRARTRTAFTIAKIAAADPMPMVSVSTTDEQNNGARRRERQAYEIAWAEPIG